MQKKAAQAIHFIHFAFMKVLQEIRRPGREAEGNFRDGWASWRYQIPDSQQPSY